MIKNGMIAISMILASWTTAAMAQDYGLTIGVHETTASVSSAAATSVSSSATGSVTGSLGYDVGVLVAFDMVKGMHFRTGLLYDLRPFEYKLTVGSTTETFNVNYAYIDVPVDVQYNVTPMFGFFGGLIVGIKASDSITTPAGITYSPTMNALYPLVNAGVNFTFNDMIGFDLYYEAGLGSFATNMSNYSTYGLHFMYWL